MSLINGGPRRVKVSRSGCMRHWQQGWLLFFFNQESINKRRLIIKLEEGEKEVGTQTRYDWLEAFNRLKPKGR